MQYDLEGNRSNSTLQIVVTIDSGCSNTRFCRGIVLIEECHGPSICNLMS